MCEWLQLVDTFPHIIKSVSDKQLVEKFHTSLNVYDNTISE